jgi:hypothetical protein
VLSCPAKVTRDDVDALSVLHCSEVAVDDVSDLPPDYESEAGTITASNCPEKVAVDDVAAEDCVTWWHELL